MKLRMEMIFRTGVFFFDRFIGKMLESEISGIYVKLNDQSFCGQPIDLDHNLGDHDQLD